MKNHLKRIATPKTWGINRKYRKFIVRPAPGAHPMERGLPLGVILRDNLEIAKTISEAKKILNNKQVLVDGKRRKDHRYITGLFDVISIPDIKKHYRVTFDSKGRIVVIEIPAEESSLKLCKIKGKTAIKGGKIQYNLYDGKNIISSEKAAVGDTFLVELPSLAVKKTFPLKEGVAVFLDNGKHRGDLGVVESLSGKEAAYKNEDKNIETLTKYLFVVGEKKSEVLVK